MEGGLHGAPPGVGGVDTTPAKGVSGAVVLGVSSACSSDVAGLVMAGELGMEGTPAGKVVNGPSMPAFTKLPITGF